MEKTAGNRMAAVIQEFVIKIQRIQYTMRSQLIFKRTRLAYLQHEYEKELFFYRAELEAKNHGLAGRFQFYNEEFAEALVAAYLERCKLLHKLAFV